MKKLLSFFLLIVLNSHGLTVGYKFWDFSNGLGEQSDRGTLHGINATGPIGEKTYYSATFFAGEKLNEFDWYDGPADELFVNGILSFEFLYGIAGKYFDVGIGIRNNIWNAEVYARSYVYTVDANGNVSALNLDIPELKASAFSGVVYASTTYEIFRNFGAYFGYSIGIPFNERETLSGLSNAYGNASELQAAAEKIDYGHTNMELGFYYNAGSLSSTLGFREMIFGYNNELIDIDLIGLIGSLNYTF